MAGSAPILAYMKPTNYCNVGCTHCYLPESIRANKNRMSLETLEHAAQLLGDMQKGQRSIGVMILWHGGEPLTIPQEWFDAANEVLDRVIPKHRQSIQTSLIPLKDEQIPWIKERLDSNVGSSIDFSQRMIKGSVENYHRFWMERVDKCREHGIFVAPGVVPTRNEIGREAWMVDWFMEREFRIFNIDRYNQYHMYFRDRPSNLEHSHFLMATFDALLDRFEKHGWSPLSGASQGAITGVLDGVGGDRWSDSCQSTFVVIEPDGGLNTCPDKSTIEEPHSYAHEGWKAFAASSFRRKWIRHQKIDHKKPYCQTCENSSWCHSGCPITPNGIPDGEDECSGYKTFINHVRSFIAEREDGEAILRAWLAQEGEIAGGEQHLNYGGVAA
ncbi:MAG: hypothetical protein Alpg2KO_28390 [Alphaproteobacteria bacterium]